MNWLILSNALLWITVVALSLVVLALARVVGGMNRRLPAAGAVITDDGPKIGTSIAEGVLATLFDSDIRHHLLVFVSPGCATCNEAAPAVKSVAVSGIQVMRTTVIGLSGDELALKDYVHRYKLNDWTDVKHIPELVGSLDITTTPYAVLATPQGVVTGKGLFNSLEQLEGLIEDSPSFAVI